MSQRIRRVLPVLALIGIVLFIFLFIFLPFVWEDIAFVIGYDIRNQYRPWFTEFRNLLKNALFQRTLPFWSWNIFYGNNVWASKAYYFIADIYSYIAMFLKGHYYNILIIQTGLKLCVSALSFYAYGSIRQWKIHTRIITAVSFAFSAWALKYIEHPFFLSFYSFMPLYFASIELFFKQKHKYLYTIIVALLLLQNYYFFFTLSIFTILYYIYRFIELDLKSFVPRTLEIIGYYLVGVLITSILIIPSALFILQNTRVFSSSQNMFFYENIRVYFHMLIGLFVPSSSFMSKIILDSGIETYASIYEPLTYQMRELMMWSGSISALLLPQIFFNTNKKQLNRISYLIMALLLILPVGGSIMHGFSEPSFRWTMLLIFSNLVLIAPFLDDTSLIDFKILKYTLIAYVMMILINLPVLSLIVNEPIHDYLDQYLLFFVTIAFLVIIYILLRKSWMFTSLLLIMIVIIESSFVSYMTFNDNPSYKKFSWEFINNFEKVLGEKYDELNYYLNSLEPNQGYYRVYAPFDSVYWYMSLNSNLMYNYSDVKTYDSTYQFSNDDILKITTMDRGLGWSWNITQKDIFDYSSVKYAIVTYAGELPHDDFTLIGNFRGLEVYQNNNFKAIARTMDEVMTYDEYQKLNDPSLINDLVLVDDADKESIRNYLVEGESTSIKNEVLYQNMLIGDFESTSNAFVVTSIAYDAGWRVFINDVQIDTYKVNGGFIGFKMPAGVNQVKLYFMPQGFKEGFILSAVGILLWIGLIVYDTVKRRRSSHV